MAGNHAEICKVIPRIKAFGTIMIALWLGTPASHGNGEIIHTIRISPSHPVESWTVNLPSHVTAKATIMIETPTGWQLVGQPTIQITGNSTIFWTRIGTTSEYRFSVTNTGNVTNSTTVNVRCVWRRTSVAGGGGPGGGGGSGAGGGPGPGSTDIHGLASALAYFLYGEQLTWEFSPPTFAAVGQKIDWTVRYFNSLGFNVPVQWNQMCPINVNPPEAMVQWKMNNLTVPCANGPGSSQLWSGNVRSQKQSSGQLQVTLTRSGTQIQKTSPVILSFTTVDLRAIDLDGIVAEQDEATPGAFVHWNIDNDDKSDNAVAGPGNKHPGGDYLQVGTAAVTGEDDLKQLAMSFGSDFGSGTIALSILDNKAKLWKIPTKGSANLVLAGPSEKTWDLGNAQQKAELLALSSSLWVEGVAEGPSQIKLAYRNVAGTEISSDLVKYTFIAANCGRQPKTVPFDERMDAIVLFPKLVHGEWSITAGATPAYNCIAWSIGNTSEWLWDQVDTDLGDNDGKIEVSDFDAFYDAKGYVTCGIGEAEILLFKNAGNSGPNNPDGITHACRKRDCTSGDGRWIMFESKRGQNVQIEHRRDQLNGGFYGDHFRYYKTK
jgi:hypothetical protein